MSLLQRSVLVALFALLAAPLAAQQPVPPTSGAVDAETELRWFDLASVRVEGQGWSDVARPFDRLPARAEAIVRPAVWKLGRDSAGICARFETDARSIHVRWTLTRERLGMPHMPPSGASGVDLYVRHDDGSWRWLANGQPRQVRSEARLANDLPAGRREYRLYLPLYNGVQSVELGLPADASLWSARPSERERIVFYGTSITQGGCASRPGMTHVAQLGRRLEREVVNLGFSGNGRMEPELAELLAELDAALVVIDCLPNMNAKLVAERAAPFVRLLREKRPKTPILLVEDRTFANAFLSPKRQAHHARSRAALRAAYETLLAEGVTGLGYLEGGELLGADGEDTVDGSHPTDLGFTRQTAAFLPALRALLED